MAYDEALTERIRLVLAGEPDLVERKMFGGIAFMVGGHMACGVLGEELIVRLGPEGAARALALPHVRKMDFTGRPMRAFVVIDRVALARDEDLERWVVEATAFVGALPRKAP